MILWFYDFMIYLLGKTVAVGTDITAFFASLKATSEEDWPSRDLQYPRLVSTAEFSRNLKASRRSTVPGGTAASALWDCSHRMAVTAKMNNLHLNEDR